MYGSLDVTQRCWAHILQDAAAECPGRREGRYGTDPTLEMPRTAVAPEIHDKEGSARPGSYATYVGQALEISQNSILPNSGPNTGQGGTQRCWAHILRDAAAEARAVGKAGMKLTDCRVLLKRLKYLTKKGPRGDHTTHVGQALEISKQYTAKFAQTLAKAAPDLFTFILYDLEPTNNHS